MSEPLLVLAHAFLLLEFDVVLLVGIHLLVELLALTLGESDVRTLALLLDLELEWRGNDSAVLAVIDLR